MKKELSIDQIEASSEVSPILFYDGVCGLCDAFVRFMIKYDKQEVFKLESLQSDVGKKISRHLGISGELDTVIGLSNRQYTTESDVLLMISDHLGGWWKVFKIIRLAPKGIRNWFYRLISRNRYQLMGKKKDCAIIQQSRKVV